MTAVLELVPRARQWLTAVLVLAGCGFVGIAATQPSALRLSLALVLIIFMVCVGLWRRRRLLVAVSIWLPLLGLVRRLISYGGTRTSVDVLLLVAPAGFAVLVVLAARARKMRHVHTLSHWVFALALMLSLEAFNPLQGSIAAGITALDFVLVPMFAFWIGRELVDDKTLEKLLRLIAIISIPAALYGLLQVFHGFPPWDKAWINAQGYTALSINGVTRPFGTFANAAEFATYLAVGALMWLVFHVTSRRAPLAIAAVALTVGGMAVEASRGVFVLFIVSVGVLIAAWRRAPLGLSLVIGAIALLLLAFAFGKAGLGDSSSTTTSNSNVLTSHLVSGISRPFDPQYSTTSVHFHEVLTGLRTAIHDPLGLGPAVVTIAGQRFSGSTQSRGTEVDPSNVAIAAGFPGLIAYLMVVLLGFRSTYTLVQQRRDKLAFAALAVISVTALQWLNGGQYAVAPLPWLVLGWVERVSRPADTDDTE
ncbi:MAG TPA: hypothetical protein VGH52_01050 [Gaiellaceae bacterium]|jgi:hypothetical protein